MTAMSIRLVTWLGYCQLSPDSAETHSGKQVHWLAPIEVLIPFHYHSLFNFLKT